MDFALVSLTSPVLCFVLWKMGIACVYSPRFTWSVCVCVGCFANVLSFHLALYATAKSQDASGDAPKLTLSHTQTTNKNGGEYATESNLLRKQKQKKTESKELHENYDFIFRCFGFLFPFEERALAAYVLLLALSLI